MAPNLFLSNLLVSINQCAKTRLFNRANFGIIKFAGMAFIILLLSFSSDKASAQLTAGFTASDTAGCAPLSVNFINTSTGATSYSWDLGNGTLSALTNASGNYLVAGTYTVTLVAHNGPATSTYSMVIRVYAPPTVNFYASDTAICPYSPVTFTSTSTPGSWGTLSYNWNFGDGYTSTAISPVHNYPAPGYYNVTLFATNAKGCINSLARPSYIHVTTPAAISFNAPATSFCKAPATAVFNNTSTGSTPITYKWDFGDGNTSTSISPSHVYTLPGSYNVRVIATDSKGCKDTLTVPNYITIGNLTASFTPVATACGATLITFNNTSTTHISSQWFFGDGASSAAETGMHAYTAAGTFYVKLVVFDGTCYDTVIHLINVSYPTGSFTMSPAHPCPPPSTLTFTGSVPPGCTVSWIYDDGTMASGPSVTHTYAASSIYSTRMVITNGSGCRDTISRLDTLYNLNLNPTVTPGNGCIPLPNTFSAYTYSVVANPFTLTTMFLSYPYPISTYSWNFGDGSPLSTSALPAHTYTAVGTYTVTCNIVTSNGCPSTNTTTVSAGTPQTPSFTATPRRICAGKSIAFHSTSVTTSLITSYSWSFGDGGGITGPGVINPVHTYTTPGIYNVTLSVDYNGCSSTSFVLSDTVDSPGSIIHYAYDCSPANGITFGDSSLGATSHLWMFGDGATSTLSGINHSYPSLSTYNVSLATYNATTGCRDTGHVSLNLAKAILSLNVLDTALCKDQSDTITGSVAIRTASQIKWYDNWTLKDTLDLALKDTFYVPGLHNINLVIKDNFGCMDTSGTLHILAANPIDSFNFTPPSGCGPLIVNFTDHSTDVTGAVLSGYTWSFGDGTPPYSGPAATSHTYTASGSYIVQETVTDDAGCTSTFTSFTHVLVHKPVASFSVTSTSVCAGTSVHFVNTSTGITSSLWFFGDGTTSTVNSPLHAYATTGVYSIKLVVYDSYGCPSDTLSMPGMVTVNFAPATSFTMSDSFAVCAPLNVSFTNTSTGAVSYYWLFGDGTSSLATSPSDVYITTGLYHVKLIGTAFNGCTDTAFHDISIFGYPGAFTYTPLSGCSPLDVHFTSTAIGVFNFHWDFSDGSTFSGSTADTISHTYHSSGSYMPTLILTDSFGCISASFGADTIKSDTIMPQFTIVPSPACQNTPITFHDASVSGTSLPMTGWLWSFGSGATSTLSNPTYTYTTSGTQTISLVVTDASGCTATITHTVTVNPGPPAISGTSPICRGTSLFFTDALSGGTWSSSNPLIASVVSGSGLVTGVAVGTATITYTSGPGCPATKAVTVSPSPGPINGANAFCVAVTSPYTDTSTGGTWSINPVTVATISPTGVVTAITAGVANISYTIGSCRSVKTITVTSLPSIITGPSSVCVGNSITLTDSIGGGTWSSTSIHVVVGSSSGLVTGFSSGAAIITYSLGTGCTKTKPITVNQLSPITGPSGVCIGGIITLADSLPGGSWSSSNPFVATVGSSSGNVTGVSGGIVTIYYTLPTGCSASHVVTVNLPPTVITGPLHVCKFDTVTLTDSIGGGMWSVSPSSIATIGSISGLVYGVSAGTAVVTYSLSNTTGCTRMTTITVNPLPLGITGTNHVCVGAATTLYDASPGGTWSTTGLFDSVGLTSGIVSGLSAGIATVSYTLLSTGCSITSLVTVNPLPANITGLSSVCVFSTTLLSDADPGGSWTSLNMGIATIGATSGNVTGGTTGIDTIVYTLPTGCKIRTTISVNNTPSSISGIGHTCVGTTTLLTDPSLGGTWISSDTTVATVGSTTGLVHGVGAGTATITYSMGIGCTAVLPVTVVPFPSSITGPNHVCTGVTITLADVSTGGAWISSNPSICTVGSSSGIVTGVNAGTALITYSLGAACNVIAPVTVNSSPAPISGSPYVCFGLYSTLTDATPGGAWTTSDAYVAPVSGTGVVSGFYMGSAIISYTTSIGCSSTLLVSVVVVPSITGLTDRCAWGDTVYVNDSFPGGVYTSTLITVTNMGAGNGKVISHAPGTATLTYTIGIGCATTTTITVNPKPSTISGSLHICTGLTSLLTDVTPGGTWSSPGYGSIAAIGSGTGIVTGISSGTAMVTYTLNATGCKTDTMITVGPPPSAISGISTVCVGNTTLLTDSLSGGTWSTSNPAVASVGSVSGIVSGLSAGTATIYYVMGASCYATRSVTVNPLPAVFTLTGGGSYCYGGAGMHVILSGSQTGVRYQLYNGTTPVDTALPGTGASVDFGMQPGVGTYTVIASYTSSFCSSNMVGSVVINIYPAPANFAITGGGTYCAGTTGTHIGLAGSTIGTHYRLYFGTSPIGTLLSGTGGPLDFGIYSGIGIYKVMATNIATSCAANMTDSTIVTITPTVTPSVHINVLPSDTVCAGTSVTFTPVAVNGGSAPVYTWKVNGTTATTGPAYTYAPANGDVVSVKLLSNAACPLPDTAVYSVTMTVKPQLLPVVTITAIPGTLLVPGQGDTLIAVVTNAGTSPTYQWYLNGVLIPGATSDTLIRGSFNNSDSLTCVVTSNGPCGGLSGNNSVTIIVSTVGVLVINNNSGIKVLPNPNKGEFTIKGTTGSSIDEEVAFEITDMLGQVVFTSKVIAHGGILNEFVRPGGSLANGVYLLSVRSGNLNNVFHIVIER